MRRSELGRGCWRTFQLRAARRRWRSEATRRNVRTWRRTGMGTSVFSANSSQVSVRNPDSPVLWLTRCFILHFHVVAGHKVTRNCGYDDDGGRHEPPIEKCQNHTFNDGSTADCRPCALCPPGHAQLSLCNSTTDTRCSIR